MEPVIGAAIIGAAAERLRMCTDLRKNYPIRRA